MTAEKLNLVYYQPDHLWTDVKAIRNCIKSRIYPKNLLCHAYQNNHFNKFIYHHVKKLRGGKS